MTKKELIEALAELPLPDAATIFIETGNGLSLPIDVVKISDQFVTRGGRRITTTSPFGVILRPREEDEGDTGRCECQNCEWTGTVAELGCQLDAVPDLLERIGIGEIVPTGECPRCGALAHLIELPLHTIQAITRKTPIDTR